MPLSKKYIYIEGNDRLVAKLWVQHDGARGLCVLRWNADRVHHRRSQRLKSDGRGSDVEGLPRRRRGRGEYVGRALRPGDDDLLAMAIRTVHGLDVATLEAVHLVLDTGRVGDLRCGRLLRWRHRHRRRGVVAAGVQALRQSRRRQQRRRLRGRLADDRWSDDRAYTTAVDAG